MGRNNNSFDDKFVIRNIPDLKDQWENTTNGVPFFLNSPMFQRRTKPYSSFLGSEVDFDERNFLLTSPVEVVEFVSPQYFNYTGSNGTVVGDWHFNENLLDNSTGSNTLAYSASPVNYGRCWPWSDKGVLSSTEQYFELNDQNKNYDFALAGDITVLFAFNPLFEGINFSPNRWLASYKGSNAGGNTQDKNHLWSVYITNTGKLGYFHEYDAGQGVEYQTTGSKIYGTQVLAFRREDNVVSFFDQMGQIGSSSATLTAPNGGSNAQLYVGGNGPLAEFGGRSALSWMQQVMVISGALSNVEISEQMGRMHTWCDF